VQELAVYRWISKHLPVSYRIKVLLAAFFGTHVPLVALSFYFMAQETHGNVSLALITIVVLSTLIGSAFTLFVLNQLLQPILVTSRSLQRYTTEGIMPDLPTDCEDEAGQLMAETQNGIDRLDHTLRRLTDYDSVTGLPNRRLFERELALRMSPHARFALCAMSLGNFDRIVAAFGQDAVNATCLQIAHRFLEILEPGTSLARAGSSTFIFEIDIRGGSDLLTERIEQIRLEIQKEISVASWNVFPDVVAGVSVFYGEPGVTAENLINQAVSAMADTSQTADGATRFFSAEENANHLDTFALDRDLRTALDRSEFHLVYQPIVDFDAGRVVGAEALLRWDHPERGLVSPDVFLPIAEKSGLIDPIGTWILNEACRQLDDWSRTSLHDLKMSMNLSVRQFLRPNAGGLIRDALRAANISIEHLEVELTETTMIENHDRTREVLEEFRSMGVSTAIDDFGAGFSSLSYLKTLPFDRLKIDREFIRDVDQSSKSSAICHSLIVLATGLGIEVLAEGTETAHEVETMRMLGCSLFQGYYFSRPVPAAQFPEAVRKAEAILERHLPQVNMLDFRNRN
jgi:EAL domain-containing protein (putative c-di-GMP-specific phosphodiesterase class I)/GGDEF domain-containing protein